MDLLVDRSVRQIMTHFGSAASVGQGQLCGLFGQTRVDC